METRQTKNKPKKLNYEQTVDQTVDHSRVSTDCDILPFPYFRQIAYASPLRMREGLNAKGVYSHVSEQYYAPP